MTSPIVEALNCYDCHNLIMTQHAFNFCKLYQVLKKTVLLQTAVAAPNNLQHLSKSTNATAESCFPAFLPCRSTVPQHLHNKPSLQCCMLFLPLQYVLINSKHPKLATTPTVITFNCIISILFKLEPIRCIADKLFFV